jgi:hypothetical protein
MGTTLYKHSYLTFAALTTAMLISSSTAMVFAAETATIKQDAVTTSTSDENAIEDLGRFIVTPKTSTFVRSGN